MSSASMIYERSVTDSVGLGNQLTLNIESSLPQGLFYFLLLFSLHILVAPKYLWIIS